jgi:hypothetical protein
MGTKGIAFGLNLTCIAKHQRNIFNLKINPTKMVAHANAINAANMRETSKSVRKIHLWFHIFILGVYHMSKNNFHNHYFVGA